MSTPVLVDNQPVGPQTQQPSGYGHPLQRPPPSHVAADVGNSQGFQPGYQLTALRATPTPILNLNVQQNLEFYTIRSTGSMSRMACDAEGRHLFSQNEVVLEYLVLCHVNFVDNTGYQFLSAEITGSGTRIMSGDLHLGTIEALVPYGRCRIYANSSVGLGSVVLKPKEGCCYGCFMCVVACCGSVSKVVIKWNGRAVGEIRDTSVTMQPDLDSRVKALVVVGSFMLFNTFWKGSPCLRVRILKPG